MSKELMNEINTNRERNKLNKNIFVALDFDNLDLALETTNSVKDEMRRS